MVTGDAEGMDDETTSPSTLSEGVGRRVEAEVRKRELSSRALESKPRCSHVVHCPLFPSVSPPILHFFNHFTVLLGEMRRLVGVPGG